MRLSAYYFLNLLILFVLANLLGAMQTTLWPQLFGGLPSPLFWLILLTYVALYRRTWEAIFIIYACSLFLAPFTVMALGFYMLLLLILAVSVQFAKTRIFWPGPGYFLIAVSSINLFYHVVHIVLSSYIEPIPMTSYDILSRLIQLLLTPLFSIPLFYLFQFVDRISHYDTLTEVGGGRT